MGRYKWGYKFGNFRGQITLLITTHEPASWGGGFIGSYKVLWGFIYEVYKGSKTSGFDGALGSGLGMS